MADQPDKPDVPEESDVPNQPRPDDDVVLEDVLEDAAPRRAASAEFVVESAVGSQAMLREAMDPANQSLAEALRLSFRVLQVVILVLLVLFALSGIQTVEAGQSGVKLRWGKILEVNGKKALDDGLQFSVWPYPAGEFVLFQDQNRKVDLQNTFWQGMRPGQSHEDAVANASVNQHLRPGRDGSVLTRGGDIAHIKLAATYEIEAPERFVVAVENESDRPGALDADRLVQLALERAAVHATSKMTLQELVDLGSAGEPIAIKRTTQELLDAVESGINVSSVDTPMDPTPAFAIKRAFGELNEARIFSQENVEAARQDYHTTLLNVAGREYPGLIELIKSYESAHALGQEAEAEAQLARINARLEGDDTLGEVTNILSGASAYRSTVDFTLGAEARRFSSLLEQFREQPKFTVQRLYWETYARVFMNPDVETLYIPSEGGPVTIELTGLDEIRQRRRDAELQRKQLETYMNSSLGTGGQYIKYGRDMDRTLQNLPGRQLNRNAGSQNNRP